MAQIPYFMQYEIEHLDYQPISRIRSSNSSEWVIFHKNMKILSII